MASKLLRNALVYYSLISSVLSRPPQHPFIVQDAFYGFEELRAQPDVPGIGIDLVEDYGIVAARFANGTNTCVAQVKGDEAYRELIRRLADPQSEHVAPPYYNLQERFEDAPRQLVREWSRNMEVPVSDTVGILSRMLSELKAASRATLDLDHPVEVVALATPHLPGLYQEDLNDALTLADITTPVSLDDIRFEAHLSRSVAAMAGNNLGLCKDFIDIPPCIDEEAHMTSQNVLTLHFGPDALDLFVDIGVRVAKQPPQQYRDEPAYYDPSLGLKHLPSISSSSEYADDDAYWSAIYAAVSGIMYDYWITGGGNELHAVLLTGEHALDRRLLKVVARVFADMLGNPKNPPIIYDGKHGSGDSDSEKGTKGVVARGAAELAWRVSQQSWTWETVGRKPGTEGMGISNLWKGDL